ncbi:MFS transporter [Candidatus Beckwithbacteria bacterium]|nr:MFS transporter [Candidatus Beckwithbacteria bacterium]
MLPTLISTILEVPTGSWADRFGRKKIYQLGLAFLTLGQFLFLFARSFYFIVFISVIWGITIALLSGPLESILYDSLVELKRKKDYKNIVANVKIVFYIARSSAAVFAGFMYTINPLIPYVAKFFTYFLALILALFVIEPKYQKTDSLSDFEQIKKAFGNIWQYKDLVYFLLYAMMFSGLGNLLWVTYQPFLADSGFDTKAIGVVYVLLSLFSAFGSFLIKKLQDRFPAFRITQFMIFSVLLISLMMFLIKNYLAVIPIFYLSVIFGFQTPLISNILNKKIKSAYRATAISIVSLAFSLMFAVFTGPVGLLIDKFGLKNLFFFNILLALVVFVVQVLSEKKF